MKLMATSDTHFEFDASEWEPAEVAIHCGDSMLQGTAAEWDRTWHSLSTMPATYKYAIPGNHDFFIEKFSHLTKKDLELNGVDLILPENPFRTLPNGMILFAIPFVINLPTWAFNRMEREIAEYLQSWSTIALPDVVVSHGPPFGILDRTQRGERVGSKAMLKWWDSLKLKPKLWAFGHIHEAYGSVNRRGTHFMNVSHCNVGYKKTNKPMYVNL